MTVQDLMKEHGETAEVFVAWAENSGVGLEHEEDWMPWWECFLAGVNWDDGKYDEEEG